MNGMIKLIITLMSEIWQVIESKISTFSGITIGSTVGGTALGVANENCFYLNNILVSTDLISLLQYSAYLVSIIIGILTIISWFRKNKKRNK